MQGKEIRRVRRWLWAALGVRSDERVVPAEAGRWGGDSRLACAELSQVLEALVRSGQVDAADARAWAADAALVGERRPKPSIAASLGLSVRGLDGRLAKLDEAIGATVALWEPPAPTEVDTIEGVVAALTAAATATVRGDRDASDAFRRIAQQHGGHSQFTKGGDRTRRMRALRQAKAAVVRIAQAPPALPRLQPLRTNGPLTVVPYTLHDEPNAAVTELRRAWTAGSVDSYPLLIDHASSRAPNVNRAGVATRLLLLEIITNILRDTESLLALPASTRWLREAMTALGPRDRQVVAAARTRAHILQLHGYLAPAADALDHLLHHLSYIRYATETERRFELIDLLLRRASVEVARREEANLDWISGALTRVSAIPEAAKHPLPARLQLHFVALRIHRERRPGARLRRQYESAQVMVLDRMATSSGAQPFAMVDTVLSCALLVGQGDPFIGHLLHDQLPRLGTEPAWANQFDRMRQRLTAANERGLTHSHTTDVPLVPHPLRVDGTLPTSPRYRV